MKERMKNVLQIISLVLCVAFTIASPIWVNAEETDGTEQVYYDTEQGRFVNDVDKYLEQLNSGSITPFNSTITDYDSGITPFELLEPTKDCSNIFGHKWGDWGNWKQSSMVHFPNPPCLAYMERVHYCTRTHCGALQKETDSVWIYSCSH